MPSRKPKPKPPKPPKPRNPVAKALRALKPKSVATRRAYKRKPKHPTAPTEA